MIAVAVDDTVMEARDGMACFSCMSDVTAGVNASRLLDKLFVRTTHTQSGD